MPLLYLTQTLSLSLCMLLSLWLHWALHVYFQATYFPWNFPISLISFQSSIQAYFALTTSHGTAIYLSQTSDSPYPLQANRGISWYGFQSSTTNRNSICNPFITWTRRSGSATLKLNIISSTSQSISNLFVVLNAIIKLSCCKLFYLFLDLPHFCTF